MLLVCAEMYVYGEENVAAAAIKLSDEDFATLTSLR